MSNNKIYINGLDYTGHVLGLNDISIEVNAVDGGVVSLDGLEFIKDAYELIRVNFIDVAPDICNELIGTIYLHCVNSEYEFKITKFSVFNSYPLDCTAIIDIVLNVNHEAHRNFKNSLWFNDDFLTAYPLPRMRYGLDRPILQAFLWAAYWIFFPILQILQAIENLFDEEIPSADNVAKLVGGLGRRKNLVRVRDLLDWHTSQNGLTWSSSILEDPQYSEAAFLQGQNVKGLDVFDSTLYDTNEFFLLTVGQKLDLFVQHFNGEWRIVNNVVYIERKDFFKSISPSIGDVQTLYNEGRIDDNSRFSIIQNDEQPAYITYSLKSDSYDEKGNELITYNRGKYLADYNTSGCFKDSGTVEIPFAPASFARDSTRGSFFEKRVDQFRKNGLSYPYQADNVLLLKSGVIDTPKLIILKSESENGYFFKAVNYSIGDDLQDYNYPLYLGNLYPPFFSINDPTNPNYEKYDVFFSDEFIYTPKDFKTTIDTIITNGLSVSINTSNGVAIPDRENGSIKINLDNGTISLSDFKA